MPEWSLDWSGLHGQQHANQRLKKNCLLAWHFLRKINNKVRKDGWKLQVHQIYRTYGLIFLFELKTKVYPAAPALLVQPCSVYSELFITTLVLADLPNALSLPLANIVLPSACSFQRTADMSLFSGTWAQIVPQS